LIFVGSIVSDRSVPFLSSYCASKAAVKGLSEALRVELMLEKAPIAVTLIKPSAMDTPFFDHALTRMGKRPAPVPPVYDPALVAEAIVHCATHPEREMVVGGGGKLMTALETFAGPLLDWYAVKTPDQQHTEEPKSADAPNALEEPVREPSHSRSDFHGRSFSLYTTMRRHPRMAAAMASGGALVAAGLAGRKRLFR
jgi:hypothetical protein